MGMNKKHIFILLTVYWLSGCTVNYASNLTTTTLGQLHLRDTHLVEREGSWTLNRESKLYLTHIHPGYIGATRNSFNRTRLTLSSYLNDAFSQAFSHTVLDESVYSLDQAVMAARSMRSDILIYPTFGAYQDNINTSSEINEGWLVHEEKEIRPDHTRFHLLVVEVKTGRVLDMLVVKSHGRFFSGTEKLPLDLFKRASYEAVLSLSGIKLS